MMITNTNNMIYAAAMECYDAAMIWYYQIFCPVNSILDDKNQKLLNRH